MNMRLPHAPVFDLPVPRPPVPGEILPELWADPALDSDPVTLLCDLVGTFGEDLALEMWIHAHTIRTRAARRAEL